MLPDNDVTPTASRGNRRRWRSGILLGVLAVIAGCTDPTAPGSRDDRLLFLSTREGVMQGVQPLADIHRMNVDGSGVENLSRAPGFYDHLAITPDGRTVIFEATRDFEPWTGSNCPTQVWRMGIDGSGPRKVTTDGCSYMPRLSPDGRRVAYLRGSEIWVIDLDGTDARHVSHALAAPEPNGCGEVPKTTVRTLGWASDTRVLFERHVCFQGTTYYSVDVEGNGLTTTGSMAASAHLSPDGSTIAHLRPLPDATTELVLVNADGTNPRTLAAPAAVPARYTSTGSVWAPDGMHIYYFSAEGHYVVHRDGTPPRRIADPWPVFRGGFNSWSADGGRLAFTAFSDGRGDIVVMKADGTDVVNLTAGVTGYHTQARWIPR